MTAWAPCGANNILIIGYNNIWELYISTDTYKPHLALISVQMLKWEREREREREGECERDKMRDNWSIRL